jgi:hypothetical protein
MEIEKAPQFAWLLPLTSGPDIIASPFSFPRN